MRTQRREIRKDARFLHSSDSPSIDPRSTTLALASDSRKILYILVYDFRGGCFVRERKGEDATQISVWFKRWTKVVKWWGVGKLASPPSDSYHSLAFLPLIHSPLSVHRSNNNASTISTSYSVSKYGGACSICDPCASESGSWWHGLDFDCKSHI